MAGQQQKIWDSSSSSQLSANEAGNEAHRLFLFFQLFGDGLLV